MNSSFKQTGDTQAIVEWFAQYPYPHCKKVNNLASLRSGVAIAQVITNKLPSSYHHLFLPNIEIYNLTPQRSITNLKILLNSFKDYFSQNQQMSDAIEQFSAQGLYFDHNMMETFIFTVLMPLGQNQKNIPLKENFRQVCLSAQQMNEIANLSSIIVNNQCKHEKEQKQKSQKIENEAKMIKNTHNNKTMPSKIQRWLTEYHHIDVNKSTPDQIVGGLVNSMFSGSRLDKQKIIKNSHYELGPIVVFKKVCDYLLQCQRMPKHNVFIMMQELQLGCIRQQILWRVIEDLMNIKISHNFKNSLSRKKSMNILVDKNEDQLHENKQNNPKVSGNIQKCPQQLIKPLKNIQVYNLKTISQAESWIKNELGYQHSLNKAKKNSNNNLQNPVLNGVLLGSIVMRLQLGKLNIIKQPKNKAQVGRNIEQVSKCIIRRGLQAGRKFSTLRPSYNNYIGILWQAKKQIEAKSQLQKMKRIQKKKQMKQISRQMSQLQKTLLKEWLQSKGITLQRYPYLPASVISELCGQILQLRLLRETTKRIKQLNMMKIQEQLRRVGWQSDCQYTDILNEQSNSLRWGIVKFSYEMLKNSVYYYR